MPIHFVPTLVIFGEEKQFKQSVQICARGIWHQNCSYIRLLRHLGLSSFQPHPARHYLSFSRNTGVLNFVLAVGVAQLVERRSVAPNVAGSIPVSHPN